MKKKIDDKIKNKLLIFQRNEITEHLIYSKLSQSTKDSHNKKILKDISNDELKHYELWKELTQQDVKPNMFNLWKYYLISKIFGITFGIKLMEKGEENAQLAYQKLSKAVPSVKNIIKDENKHEKQLINLIDEELLRYVGSVVLGLNDALVELTGALAGFTLALQNTRLIAVVGLITGIAAALSMAASEYLSTKEEEGSKNPLKASIYTGIAYIFTVLFLVFPYLIFANYYFSLGITILNAIIVIFLFNFYISIAKDISFSKRFFEMTFISLGIAALTFVIGILVRMIFKVQI